MSGGPDAMPALVTGAGGFLGRHLVAALVARGEPVRALDLGFDPPLDDGAAGVETVTGDIRDPALLARACQGAGSLFHLAALTDLWQPDPRAYQAVNVGGTRTVFEAAAAAGIRRAVHVSSYVTLIAGPRFPDRTASEDPAPPLDAMIGDYARSKWQAERVALSFAGRMEVVAVLPSAPIGALDYRLTPPMRLIRDLFEGALPATLDCLVNFVDARAVAEAFVAARDVAASGERILLAGEDLTMREFLDLFARVSGRPVPRRQVPYALALAAAVVEDGIVSRITGRRPTAPLAGVRLAGRRVRFDAAKARAALGFAPPPLEASLRTAIDWLTRHAG